jgi:hypothetical protein
MVSAVPMIPAEAKSKQAYEYNGSATQDALRAVLRRQKLFKPAAPSPSVLTAGVGAAPLRQSWRISADRWRRRWSAIEGARKNAAQRHRQLSRR